MDSILPGKAQAPIAAPPSLDTSSQGGEGQRWGLWVLITPSMNAHPCNPLPAGVPANPPSSPAFGEGGDEDLGAEAGSP